MTMTEQAKQAIKADVPGWIQVLLVVVCSVVTITAVLITTKNVAERNTHELSSLREEVSKEVARLESKRTMFEMAQRGLWKENETEHDQITKFSYETRNIISAVQSGIKSLEGGMMEVKYELREARSELKLNRAEMKAWEHDRIAMQTED